MTIKNLDPARLRAFHALLQLWQEGGQIEESSFSDLDPPDRARAFRLTREVLRNEAGFDRVIKNNAKTKPSPPARAILHLGFHELLIDGTAAHGVVHAWVEIAKSDDTTKKASGFINALLRKTDRERPKLIPTNQYGKALRKHLSQYYDSSTLDQINKLQSHYPGNDIFLREGEDLQIWAKRLNATHIENTRALRLPKGVKISELPGFSDGKWWVQDVASQIAASLFDNLKGRTALDLCAAPGGKTMQLADQGAILTAVEISKKRAHRIRDNLARTGLNATLHITDARQLNATQYEAILLDAPCSATGTIRRHPDLRFDDPWVRAQALIPLQKELLAKAFSLLSPNGTLIYCTCSLLPSEGEEILEAFLSQNPSAESTAIMHPFLYQKHRFLRILPHHLSMADGCDGFFIAKIRKAA